MLHATILCQDVFFTFTCEHAVYTQTIYITDDAQNLNIWHLHGILMYI